MGEITLGDNYSGKWLHDLDKELPEGVQITMLRKGGQNLVPAGEVMLAPGDGLLVVTDDHAQR